LESFHRFKEEASKTGVTEEELAHILEASQQG